MILKLLKLFSLFFFFILILSCHTTKEVTASQTTTETNGGAVTEDTTVKNTEDSKNPNAKAQNETPIDCLDKTFASPSMICDNENTPVCGCNNVNYKNPCEAEKVGVRYYKWGKCTKAAKTGPK